MFNQPTVFVLGAGSSAEFGLPVGSGLAQTICNKLAFDHHPRADERLRQAIYLEHGLDRRQCLAACKHIVRGLMLARSIDDFLEMHGDSPALVRMGKTAIVASILEAEKKSRLVLPHGQPPESRDAIFRQLHDTWAYRLLGFLVPGVRRARVRDVFTNLTIINFNYDRCVETFFYEALQRAYSLGEAEAAEAMQRLSVLHPYGTVGRLPWQSGEESEVEYGQELTPAGLMALADRIKTFTEQSHDELEMRAWRSAIAQAQRLVFLGFAFHQQNVEILSIEPRIAGGWPSAWATAYGASEQDQYIFKRRMFAVRGSPPAAYSDPVTAPIKCADFIAQYGLSLTS